LRITNVECRMKKELKGLIERPEKKKIYVVSIRQTDLGKIHRLILTSLSKGQAISPQGIADNININLDAVTRHLKTLDENDIIRFKEGKIESAYPFTTKPTTHQLIIGQSKTYALCAVDALGVPSMLQKDVSITSSCSYCEKSIAVDFQQSEVNANPGNLVVWMPRKKVEGKSVNCMCPHIDFFCNREHADSWQEKIGYQGVVLNLREAIEVGEFIFGDFLK